MEAHQNISFVVFSRWELSDGAEELHGKLWALLSVTETAKLTVLILRNEPLATATVQLPTTSFASADAGIVIRLHDQRFWGVSGPLTLGAIYAQHLSPIMEPFITLGYHVHLGASRK